MGMVPLEEAKMTSKKCWPLKTLPSQRSSSTSMA
jgi:hypothetical protein